MRQSEFNYVHEQLGAVKDFHKPKIAMEQYMTDRDCCVEIFKFIDRIIGIEDKTVIDLGSGTGMLGIGALLCNANHVTFVEIDPDPINIAKEALNEIADDDEWSFEFVNQDALTFIPAEKVDIVISNPPFGTKNNENIDSQFVIAAFKMIKENGHIFSLHKTSTVDGLIKKVSKDMPKAVGERVADIRWILPKTHHHQKQKVGEIAVSLLHWTTDSSKL